MIKKIILGTLAVSSIVMADMTNTNVFKTHTELGYIQTQGNTETENFLLNFRAKKGWGADKLKATFNAQYAKNNGVESKNSFITELIYDHDFTKRFAFNYLIGYKEDKFSGYNSQFYTGPGAKYIILHRDRYKWDVTGNLLYSQDSIAQDDTVVPPINAHTHTYSSYIVKTRYKWKILDNLNFTQRLSYKAQIDDTANYFVYSKSTIASKINGTFSVGINYIINYSNNPPSGKKYTDKTFAVSLIIDY